MYVKPEKKVVVEKCITTLVNAVSKKKTINRRNLISCSGGNKYTSWFSYNLLQLLSSLSFASFKYVASMYIAVIAAFAGSISCQLHRFKTHHICSRL